MNTVNNWRPGIDSIVKGLLLLLLLLFIFRSCLFVVAENIYFTVVCVLYHVYGWDIGVLNANQ